MSLEDNRKYMKKDTFSFVKESTKEAIVGYTLITIFATIFAWIFTQIVLFSNFITQRIFNFVGPRNPNGYCAYELNKQNQLEMEQKALIAQERQADEDNYQAFLEYQEKKNKKMLGESK